MFRVVDSGMRCYLGVQALRLLFLLAAPLGTGRYERHTHGPRVEAPRSRNLELLFHDNCKDMWVPASILVRIPPNRPRRRLNVSSTFACMGLPPRAAAPTTTSMLFRPALSRVRHLGCAVCPNACSSEPSQCQCFSLVGTVTIHTTLPPHHVVAKRPLSIAPRSTVYKPI